MGPGSRRGSVQGPVGVSPPDRCASGRYGNLGMGPGEFPSGSVQVPAGWLMAAPGRCASKDVTPSPAPPGSRRSRSAARPAPTSRAARPGRGVLLEVQDAGRQAARRPRRRRRSRAPAGGSGSGAATPASVSWVGHGGRVNDLPARWQDAGHREGDGFGHVGSIVGTAALCQTNLAFFNRLLTITTDYSSGASTIGS